MFFKDYKHIELIEDDIKVSENRKGTFESIQTVKGNRIVVATTKITGVKNWKPTNPYRLRVTATVRKAGKRTIKKKTYLYENIYMVDALKEAGKELDNLIDEIKKDIVSVTPTAPTDKDRMFTFGEAFGRSLKSRKEAAGAENEEFKTYKQVQDFYTNHLKEHLEDMLLDHITSDTLNSIRANMKTVDVKASRKTGRVIKTDTPCSKRTKLSVLQQVNPVYSWFNDYSNLSVKTPAKIKKGTLKKLGNKRVVRVKDISPLFNAMANYSYKFYAIEKTDPFQSIFIWLLHGRRVNEVLSLRWEDINLSNETYTIAAKNNKAGIEMTYKLTPYQIKSLPEPRKKGLVFPSLSNKEKQMVQPTLQNHWYKVRDAVGDWTLNGKTATPSDLHIHDIRHLIATEMLNKHHVVDEISGAVLGHTRSGITSTYAEMLTQSVDDAIMKVLDGVIK